MSERPEFIWFFDHNRRVYPKDRGIGCGPIWREHWRKDRVVGETSRSWVLSDGRKFAKKDGESDWVAFSEKHIDELEWKKVFVHKIVDRVERASPEVLRQIAKLVGFTLEAPK